MKTELIKDRLRAYYGIELTEIDRGDHYYDGHTIFEAFELYSKKNKDWITVKQDSTAEKLLLSKYGGLEALEELLYDQDEIFEYGEEHTQGY